MPKFNLTVRDKSTGETNRQWVETTSEARAVAEAKQKGLEVESVEKIGPDTFLGLEIPEARVKTITYEVVGKSKATGMRMEFMHKAPDEYAMAAELADKYEIESCRVVGEKVDYTSKIYYMILAFFVVSALVGSCNCIMANSQRL